MELPGGLMGCVDHEQRVIWLTTGLTQAERRCTIAHEVGHLERGPAPDDPALADQEERAVDAWAARLLIPTGALVRAFQWSQHLDEVAEELWVDERMLRARLRALTDDEQDKVMAALRKGTSGTAVASVAAALIAVTVTAVAAAPTLGLVV